MDSPLTLNSVIDDGLNETDVVVFFFLNDIKIIVKVTK